MKKVLTVIILLLLIIASAHAQSQALDSLIRVLPTTPDNRKIDVYQGIVIRLWLNHPDSAMQYAQQAMRLAHATDDMRIKAIAYRLISGTHYCKGNYDSTIKYSYASYAFSRQTGDSALMSSSMNNIGLAYYDMASYPEALEYLLRALNLKTPEDYGYIQTLCNIGLVYNELKDHDKARRYFLRADSMANRDHDKDQHLFAMNNIGRAYLYERKLDKAEEFFNEALTVANTIDNVNWHAIAYSGMAQVYLLQGKSREAHELFKKSLSLRQRIGDAGGIAEVYSFYGSIYTKMDQWDSARYYLHKSQSMASSISDKSQMITNYDRLKELFVKEQRFDSALYYQTKFIELRDNVFNVNLARNIQDIQLQVEREEAGNKLAAKDNEIRKITVQTYFLAGLIILSMVFSIFLYKAYKDHRQLSEDLVKTNKETMLQKEEIHEQRDRLALSHAELEMAKEVITQKNVELSRLNWQLQNTVDKRTRELERANEELKIVNLELDNFIYRSSHDIRGPMVRLTGICHVALMDIEDSRARDYFVMISAAAQQLNEIFDRLKIVSHINETDMQPVKINFNELLTQVLDRLKNMEGFNEVEIETENAVNEWYSDPFLLEMVLFNIIENSIRFQKKETSERKFVKIKTARSGRQVKMAIIDNGIGIQEPVDENLYQMFSKAARDHKNVGLGLYIVKQCLNKLNGSINLVKNELGYTEFEVVHPIVN